jgi:lipopolysaccharide export system protein LptA
VPDPDLPCPEEIKTSDTPITLKEGRTTITGLNFLYNNANGIGTMKGPITLDRVAEGDSPALKASSDALETNVDEDKTFLTGNVRVESEDRISEAERLEYDEENSIAILTGNPAKSTKGEDVLTGTTIIYFLDSNDVVVENVEGEINVDLGDSEATSSESGTDTQTPEPPPDQE